MKPSFVENCILRPIYFFRGEDVFQIRKMYMDLEKGGVEAIHNYKLERVQNLCNYASKTIPYFKKLNIDKNAGLGAFPVLRKDDIRMSMNDFLLPDIRYSWRSTSGSTGNPFVFPKDRDASAHMDALMYHLYSWHGVNMGDSQARLWGTPLRLQGRMVQKTRDFLLNRKRLSAFLMDDYNSKRFFYELRQFRPRYFYAYTNALYQFALSLERQGLDGRELEIPVAICTGEVLFPFQREKIMNTFGCKVINEYGSTENGIIAFECEHEKLHVATTLELEILNTDSYGFGNVVITELNSKAIPFIRYDIGDVARFSHATCDCGRPERIIEIKEGRVDDYVVCPDGSRVYDAIFAYSLKNDVEKFKVVQESRDSISISIIPKQGFRPSDEQRILAQLRKYLGQEIEIVFSIVDNIPPEKSGKLRYFESRIK